MPLISVIIPAYNAEKTIRETIASVLNQTFSDFELIIINDGSKDSTLDIISQIQDSRIKVFSYPNAGPQKSRNRGLAKATGEYVSFLDADDLWTPDKLESQLSALQANPTAGVAYSWTNFIDENGKFYRRGGYLSFTGDVYQQLLLLNFLENGSNPLINKKIIDEVGGFDESIVGGQDWDMWLRLAARCHFVCVPSPQIMYRKSPTSSANSWSSNVERQETGLKQVLKKAFEQNPDIIQHLHKDIIANFYKFLVFDILQGKPGKRSSITATRFLWIAIRNDPSLLGSRVMLKVILKIAVMFIFPPKIAEILITKAKNILDIQALLGYLRLDPS